MNMGRVSFYYDLGSPYAYLAADRIDEQFDVSIEVDWVPVLLGGLHKATDRGSWAHTPARDDHIAELDRRAAAYGLPALNYPEEWPNNGLTVMRVATWAHSAGAGRRFARAGFEVQFVDGMPLSDPEAIELAAHRAGLEPHFALAAAEDPAVKQALRENTQNAFVAGVTGVPAVQVGDQVFWGDDRLHEAVAAAGS